MIRAIVTVGAQGVGKTTLCEKVVSQHPEVVIVSRDQIFLDLFAVSENDRCLTDFDPRHTQIFETMWEFVAESFKKSHTQDVYLILDCWNRGEWDRRIITHSLRKLGADVVGAWHFITPFGTFNSWHKEDSGGNSTTSLESWKDQAVALAIQSERTRQYRLYQMQKIELSQGFDFIVQVDPLIPPPFEVLFGCTPPSSQKASVE